MVSINDPQPGNTITVAGLGTEVAWVVEPACSPVTAPLA